jgi:hypothetical protein
MNNVQAKYAKLRAEHRVLTNARELMVRLSQCNGFYNQKLRSEIEDGIDGIEDELKEAAEALVKWASGKSERFKTASKMLAYFGRSDSGYVKQTIEIADLALQLPGEEKNASPPLENMRFGG